MTNRKPPDEQRNRHLTLNFTEEEMKKVRSVQNMNPNSRISAIFLYGLMKTFGSGLERDYRSQYLQYLHQQTADIDREIARLKEKRKEIEEEIGSLMEEEEEGTDEQ